MDAILDCACRRLQPGGRIVINAATLENLHRAAGTLGANGFAVDTTLVNIARSKDISDLTRLKALNPVFIITGKRKGER
jgi:precorrin-6Y C5,15-methyltransferase (decarboxylating)